MTEKLCCVCNKQNSSYKCPKCKESYCSAACCKVHRQSDCEPPIDTPVEETSKQKHYDFPTEDTVPLDKLELLKGSEDVNECLKNRHVRDIVTAILKDEDPTRAIGLAMTEPIFMELANACLKVVEPPDEEKPC